MIFVISLITRTALSSVQGKSYIDDFGPKTTTPKYFPGEDPCNPLYWYPRPIPEECNKDNEIPPRAPIPLPIPVPMSPQPLPPYPPMFPAPAPFPMFPPMFPPIAPPIPYPPMPMPMPMPMPAPMPVPIPYPIPPLPYGIPITATNPMLPVAGIPYPPMQNPISPYPGYNYYGKNPQSQAGFVPGIEGLVSTDGGINVLPFSDVYSDMLEKHKQKTIRKRLQKLLDEYEFSMGKRRY